MTEETFDPGLTEAEKELLEGLLYEEENQLSDLGIQRRNFLKQVLAAGGGVLALELVGDNPLIAENLQAPADGQMPGGIENMVKVGLKVNGVAKSLEVDSRMTLLDALREKLALTGAKKGCDHGQCGACTVLSDGQRILSCLTLAASCEGRSITTIEGLVKNGQLHPMQASFLKHDGFQCGFCTPGQICSAVALIKEAKNGDASYLTSNLASPTGAVQLSADEIRERMSGNICRCGAYPNIVAAIEEVHLGKDSALGWSFVEQTHEAI
ncbi:MAG: ferredoxin [Ferruginibacter sp.]|nr:ferredoxin [Ferruginibacter sp.]